MNTNFMDTKLFIDELFSGYEEDSQLRDFKEELLANLNERIGDLISNGMDEMKAFKKATGELGDITPLADEMSLKRKQEVYADMYMRTRNYISTKRMILYISCTGIFIFGIIAGLIGFMYSGVEAAAIGTMIPFGILPAGVAVFLGLTQETGRHEPMGWKRALIYAVTAACFFMGIIIFVIVFFERGAGLPAALATLIVFCLPSALVMAFLILTEKDRNKPWVREQQNKWINYHENRFENTAQEARYGLLCGALWIFAVAGFIGLGFLLGFKFSWVVFIFAVGFQLLIEYKFNHQKV